MIALNDKKCMKLVKNYQIFVSNCLYRPWSLNVALNYLKEATSPYKCEKCKKRRNPVNQNFPNYLIFARTILKKSNPY